MSCHTHTHKHTHILAHTHTHTHTGGALSRSSGPSASRNDLVRVPTPTLGADLGQLLASGEGADCEFAVEDEVRLFQISVRAWCAAVPELLNFKY
jgi:hypothetical protein